MSTQPDTGHDALARAVVASLSRDPQAIWRLRALVAPEPLRKTAPPAYTVASLAEVIGVTPKVIRNAVARGELTAVKRGGRWIISSDAVAAWTHPTAVGRRYRQVSGAAHPLRAALERLDGAQPST